MIERLECIQGKTSNHQPSWHDLLALKRPNFPVKSKEGAWTPVTWQERSSSWQAMPKSMVFIFISIYFTTYFTFLDISVLGILWSWVTHYEILFQPLPVPTHIAPAYPQRDPPLVQTEGTQCHPGTHSKAHWQSGLHPSTSNPNEARLHNLNQCAQSWPIMYVCLSFCLSACMYVGM